MKKFEFSKNDTAIIKGIAIILMFAHHLFAFPDRINDGNSYISMLSIGGTNVEYFIGQFGKICVSLFIFLSGFGMYKKITNNRKDIVSIIFKQLKTLYINYWIIFMIFVPISFFIFGRKFDFSELFDNFVGYSSSYDGEWWFFEVYVLIIISFPIVIKVVRSNAISSIVNIMLINVTACTILPMLIKNDIFVIFEKSFFYEQVSCLLVWLPSFLIGCTFAKFDLFSKIKNLFEENNLNNIFVYLLICIGIVYIRYRSDNTTNFDYLFAPIFIFGINSVVKEFKLDKLFAFLGKHSTNMWLMHSFFCYQYYQWLVYYPKISIFVLGWLGILTVSCSMIIIHVRKEYNKLINRELIEVKLSSNN